MHPIDFRDIQCHDGGIGKYANTTILNFSENNMESAEKVLPSSLLKLIGKDVYGIKENDEGHQYENKIAEGTYESMFTYVDNKYHTPMYVTNGTKTYCSEIYHEISLFYAGSPIGIAEVYLYHGDMDELQLMDEEELPYRMAKNIWYAFDNEVADLSHIFNANNLLRVQENYYGSGKLDFCYIHKIKMNEQYLALDFQEALLKYIDKIITKEKYPILIQAYCSYFPNSGEFFPNKDPDEKYQDTLISNTKKYYDNNPLYSLEDCGKSVFVVKVSKRG